MNKNLIKWLQLNVEKFDLNKSTDKKDMIFVHYNDGIKLKKHLDRLRVKYKSACACNYEWVEITLEN